MKQSHGAAEDVVTRSIRMLADHGYLETTVEQLAQTAGISRATFFRKYGSKEDVVFADHAATLDRLELLLERPALPPQGGLVEGAQLVFRHALEDPDRAVARHDLLQRVESLRDREIAMSSRYERVFRAFLRRSLPDFPDREVTAVALASATVAVHNSFLRAWLRDPHPSAGERLVGSLSDRVAWLCAVFGVAPDDAARQFAADVTCLPAAATLDREDPAASGEGSAPIVVVLPEGVDPADAARRVARSVYRALRG
ncbi:TetR/AcrR family transcriptional regulator [Kocuria sp.]|uniref:TetR/AcrR family transcriptional regulator n=1 Tax=Kocuria sp. TaxID=1871328 RepID=UPI0026DB038C|nr:TetR/AcrR family transcriptional regulator [Kocuria sp.]MDO4918905.1 TetR/AcrR family transcriptional regulator [Kocuria sp.]